MRLVVFTKKQTCPVCDTIEILVSKPNVRLKGLVSIRVRTGA